MSEPNVDIVDNEVLEDAHFDEALEDAMHGGKRGEPASAPTSVEPENKKTNSDNFSQWAINGNGRYTPVGASVESLPAGIYEAFATPATWGLERMKVFSDEIYELPDMATSAVLAEAETFWNNEDRYKKHNLMYKRGIILYGPPGSGKTVTIKLLMNKLVSRGGIVLVVQNPALTTMCLKAIKRVEPERNMICIFEDIDEILRHNAESQVLSMLDGEHNVDRVLNIATTNYPDKLGPRIINRPSRFDRRVLVGMPNAESRRFYLTKTTGKKLKKSELEKWVADTDQMSVSHLRELVAAVYCLDQPYDEVISRLKDMAKQVKPEEDFKRERLGFKGGQVVLKEPW